MDIREFVGERIRRAREDASLTQEELGEKYGCAHSHISRIEKGKVGLELADLDKMGRILKKPRSYFIPPEEAGSLRPIKALLAELTERCEALEVEQEIRDESTIESPSIDALDLMKDQTFRIIPVYDKGLTVTSDGRLVMDGAEPVDYIPILAKEWKPTLFGIVVRGDNLEPAIEDGNTVVIDPDIKPVNGKHVLCSYAGASGETEVGIRRYRQDGEQIWLEDNHRPFVSGQCRIHGVAILATRRL